jgi:hypothetical protein
MTFVPSLKNTSNKSPFCPRWFYLNWRSSCTWKHIVSSNTVRRQNRQERTTRAAITTYGHFYIYCINYFL